MTGTRWFISIFIFVSVFGFAQIDTLQLKLTTAKDLKKRGNNAVLQDDYNSAIIYYTRYLKVQPKDSKVEFKLAECYRKIRNYEKAEFYYDKAYKGNPQKNATALFYYASMLKTHGEYDKAKESFTKFSKEYKGEEKELKKLSKQEIAYCDSAKAIAAKPPKQIVQHLDTTINKVHVELSPVSISENEMLYASLRSNQNEYVLEGDDSANVPVRKFYSAKKENGEWKFTGEFQGGEFNVAGENVGNAAFTPDRKKMYFTRCKPNWKGIMVCAIYMTQKVDDRWTEPVKLPKTINNPNYTSTMPTVAMDLQKGNEIVYYVSNRKDGGRGGLDIWYFVYSKKSKMYKAPKNAGVKINTPKNEMTPFFDNETGTLYFSSEGWGGLGGLDVYKVTGDSKKWTERQNVGQPINSGADDIYYTISKNREEGFFVSNRTGAVSLKHATCCDDIYSYKQTSYIHLKAEGNVKELLSGGTEKNIDSAYVELYMLDKAQNTEILVQSVPVDKDGNYTAHVEAGMEYKLVAKRPNYLSATDNLSTKDKMKDETFVTNFKLTKLPTHAIAIENISYEFDKSDLTASSKNILDTTIYKIMVLNPEIVVELGSHTDSKGSTEYNQKLSQKRAESVVNYLVSKGIPAQNLKAQGYGETQPVAPNKNKDGSDNPEGRAKNRRTEFKIIGTITNFGDED